MSARKSSDKNVRCTKKAAPESGAAFLRINRQRLF